MYLMPSSRNISTIRSEPYCAWLLLPMPAAQTSLAPLPCSAIFPPLCDRSKIRLAFQASKTPNSKPEAPDRKLPRSRLHPRAPEQQLSAHPIHRSFRVGAMLAGPRAAARVMRDLDQRQLRQAEELRLGARQLHKNRLAQGDRRLALLLQLDGVVDTPRRARPSSAQA